MNEHFFEERGLYYRTNEFQPDRPTLVFIHGLSGSSSAWAPYEPRFEQNYNILAFDLRGHGKSRKPRWYQEYAVMEFTKDMRLLLEYLHIDDFIMIAHSFAVLFALDFLAEHPEKVRAAILLSPAANVGNRPLERILKFLVAPIPLLQYLPWNGKPREHIDYSKYKGAKDWDIPCTFADVRNTTLRVWLFCTKQSYTVNHENVLSSILIPVLLIHGKKDTIFPVQGAIDMAARIPHAELVLLNDADHILVNSYVPHVYGAMKNFLNKIFSQATTGNPPKSSF